MKLFFISFWFGSVKENLYEAVSRGFLNFVVVVVVEEERKIERIEGFYCSLVFLSA